MIRISDKTRCCGCTACQSICPHGAIVMKTDVLGFPYPFVYEDKCTDCGLCEDVCDFTRHDIIKDIEYPVDVYAVRNKDRNILAASQSGGAFSALSDVVLAGGGSVYGAVMNEDHSVSHVRAVTYDERNRMRGSKYVQSYMTDVFRMVRKDLAEGRKVLFTGTPCQVAGLAAYIPDRLCSDLLLLDFICHGVPSPSVWKDYVSSMSSKGKLKEVRFRDKRCGWKVHKESFLYENGKMIFSETYRVLFYKNIMLRDSCAVCPYSLSNRKSDLTMADFWGVGSVLPELDGDEGTSMIICHTEKGKDFFMKAVPEMDVKMVQVDKEFLSSRNPNILRPSHIDKDRRRFEEAYGKNGFSYVARRWGDLGWRYKAWKLKVFLRKMTGKK